MVTTMRGLLGVSPDSSAQPVKKVARASPNVVASELGGAKRATRLAKVFILSNQSIGLIFLESISEKRKLGVPVPSSTVENYLKQILLITLEREEKVVPMGLVSESLAVTPGTATSMAKNLEKEGWLSYEPRRGVSLKPAGRKLGLNILRRHRLLETFLVETLGLDWSEIHEEAEELEHAISEKVLERLDDFLGRPRHDPHGHPIPTKGGVMQRKKSRSLVGCKEGLSVVIESIDDQERNFLKFARSRHLLPGKKIKILSREEEADAMEIRVEGKKPFSIGFEAARKILVSA